MRLEIPCHSTKAEHDLVWLLKLTHAQATRPLAGCQSLRVLTAGCLTGDLSQEEEV